MRVCECGQAGVSVSDWLRVRFVKEEMQKRSDSKGNGEEKEKRMEGGGEEEGRQRGRGRKEMVAKWKGKENRGKRRREGKEGKEKVEGEKKEKRREEKREESRFDFKVGHLYMVFFCFFLRISKYEEKSGNKRVTGGK